MLRRTAALYLDFDNIIGGLMPHDSQAGLEFANNPKRWINWLKEADEDGCERDFLIMKCYMNSQGYVRGPQPRPMSSVIGDTIDPAVAPKPQKFYHGQWRSFFTKAGFEIVDCPPLSSYEKNGADIKICLDIMDSLRSRVVYDEYVIASGDSDFTPLLQRIRADDRRITLLTTNPTSSNLRALASVTLGVDELLPVLRPRAQFTTAQEATHMVTQRPYLYFPMPKESCRLSVDTFCKPLNLVASPYCSLNLV
jgi:NYN domain